MPYDAQQFKRDKEHEEKNKKINVLPIFCFNSSDLIKFE